MKGHRTLLGMTAVIVAAALAFGCENTAKGVKKDAEQAKEEGKDAAQQSKETAREVGEEAKEAGRAAGEKAEKVGEKIGEAAKEVAGEVKAAKQTVDIKAALMADSSVDSSNIDVDTNDDTKTVTLKGTVPTAAQKATVGRIAKEKAEGYRIDNMLKVAPKR